MERLPKLRARKPPNQSGGTSTGVNTDHAGPETIRLQETVPQTAQPLFVSPAPAAQLVMVPPPAQGAPLLLTQQQQDALAGAYVFQR